MASAKRVPYLFLLIISFSSHAQHVERSFTKGVYGDPAALLANGMSFRSLGINAIFVRSVSLDSVLYEAARKEEVRVYVEFPTLNGKEYLGSHPEAWPIDHLGERAAPADWFMGICPTDSGFRSFREAQLRSILAKFKVDGIWLDYVHWHAQFETGDPILPETCFCERCIRTFEARTALQVPGATTAAKAQWIFTNADSSWRVWRSEVLNGWVRDMKAILTSKYPNALLGIYYCPWFPDEYAGAQYRILGLDLNALAEIADVFSPMLYHQMMDKQPEWTGEYVEWLKNAEITDGRNPKIWPIVQAHNKPGVITTEEFRRVMWDASRFPASGIMMFTLHSLLGDPGKFEVMKDLYRKR